MFAIGQNLYLKRLAKGMTQLELVQKTGIPQPNLSRIERGKQDITVSTLLNLCSALGVRSSEILEDFIEKKKALAWTRQRLERVARAAVTHKRLTHPLEQRIAENLSKIVPGCLPKTPIEKEIYYAWQELRHSIGRTEIKTLVERVREAMERK